MSHIQLTTDPVKAAETFIASHHPKLMQPGMEKPKEILVDAFVTGMLHLGSILLVAAHTDVMKPAVGEVLDNLADWTKAKLIKAALEEGIDATAMAEALIEKLRKAAAQNPPQNVSRN